MATEGKDIPFLFVRRVEECEDTGAIPPPSGTKWNCTVRAEKTRAEGRGGEGSQRRPSADLRHFATRLFTDMARQWQAFSTRWWSTEALEAYERNM